MSCGVGHRRGSDLVLLWLCRRPPATAPIRPTAWETPHGFPHSAWGAALKRQNKGGGHQLFRITWWDSLLWEMRHQEGLGFIQGQAERVSFWHSASTREQGEKESTYDVLFPPSSMTKNCSISLSLSFEPFSFSLMR